MEQSQGSSNVWSALRAFLLNGIDQSDQSIDVGLLPEIWEGFRLLCRHRSRLIKFSRLCARVT